MACICNVWNENAVCTTELINTILVEGFHDKRALTHRPLHWNNAPVYDVFVVVIVVQCQGHREHMVPQKRRTNQWCPKNYALAFITQ